MPEVIANTIDDLVADFLFYDRKEDEELSEEDLHKFLEKDFSVDRVVARFREKLLDALK